MTEWNGNQRESFGYNALMAPIRDSHGIDPWATNMGWLFAACDVLWHSGEDIPDELQYRHSPILTDCANPCTEDDYETEMIASVMRWPNVTVEDLKRVLGVLSRYDNLCRLSGLNY